MKLDRLKLFQEQSKAKENQRKQQVVKAQINEIKNKNKLNMKGLKGEMAVYGD